MSLSSIFFGLSIGTKISGFIFLLVAWFFFFKKNQEIRKTSRFIFSVFLVFIPSFVVFMLMFSHFLLLDPHGSVLNTTGSLPSARTAPIFDAIRQDGDESLFLQHLKETVLGLLWSLGGHLQRQPSVSYSSRWYSWPFMVKPIGLFYEKVNGSAKVVASLGNPVIWFLGLVAFFAILIRRIKRKEFLDVDPLIFGYVGYLGFSALFPRELFLYHYLPALTFLVLLTTFFLSDMLINNSKQFWGLAPTVILGFLFFAPFTYGFPF